MAPSVVTRPDPVLVALLVVVVAGVILQITVGGIVRVTGSGLGCPDWPLCHGRLVPPPDLHAWIEWTHRTIGSLVGVALLATTIRVWMRHRHEKGVLWLTTGSLGLIILVGGIGATVVLSELHPALRTLHLGLAEINLALTLGALALATRAFGAPVIATGEVAGDVRVGRIAWLAGGATLVALLSGSYAVWQGAGGVCASWPLCGGPIVPQSGLAWVHMTHRVLAGVGAVVLLIAAHRAFRLPSASSALRRVSLAALVIVVAQVLVGAANPWTRFEEWARALHLTLGTLMWAGALLMAILISLRGTRPNTVMGTRSGD